MQIYKLSYIEKKGALSSLHMLYALTLIQRYNC